MVLGALVGGDDVLRGSDVQLVQRGGIRRGDLDVETVAAVW